MNQKLMEASACSYAKEIVGQGDQMSLWKKSPKMKPKPFIVKFNT
jgi:hypothetical protein